MADVSDPITPKITTAASASVVNDDTQELLMRLRNGAEHETVAGQPLQYNISAFTTTDRPFSLSQQNGVHLGRMDTAIYALPMGALMERIHGPRQQAVPHRIAQPLRVSGGLPGADAGRRSPGRSLKTRRQKLRLRLHHPAGPALLRPFLHRYRPGQAGQVLPLLRCVVGQPAFCRTGLFLLWQMASGGRVLSAITGWFAHSPSLKRECKIDGTALSSFLSRFQSRPQRAKSRHAFPRILDEYVVREFLNTFFLVLAGFVMLMLVFTFFELVGDILRNHIPLTTVGAYLVNLAPSMLYQISPLAVLLATLVTFGVLNRNSELIAMKATGISLYRLVVPIVSIAAILAVSLFLFDEFYLPQANRRQEALRSIIKGRPPQTFLHPEQKWIFGQPHPGEPARIFYYQFFDADKNEFGNLSLFEFDPSTFALSRRVFATRVFWDEDKETWHFQNGWQRDIQGPNVTEYREFKQTSFSEIHEGPGYFKKESLQSQEMNFGQLDTYIRDLRQSGFDTMRLRVALWHKLAYPLIAVVMVMLAMSFCAFNGPPRLAHRHRRGHCRGACLLGGRRPLRSDGHGHYLPAPLAAWSSDILFGLVGGYLLLRTPT